MPLKTPQTELEAVNIILSSVGEDPVDSLSSDTTGRAEATLDEVSREIQERGWHFNTENDYSMSIDVDGHVDLPTNVAQFRLNTRYPYDIVMRGSRLYDRKGHTDVFVGTELKGTVTWVLEWDELPPTAKRYFAMEAAHRYQKRWFGSETLFGFTDEDLRKARELFKSTEALQSNATIFDNYAVFRTLDRKSGSEFVN
jgi:hypothetical protein